LALFLAALMLVSIAACGKTNEPTKDTTPDGPTDTNAPETEPAETDSPFDPGDLDDLPADLDYDGADFTFCSVGKEYRMTIDQDDAVDRYDNAVYERTLAIERRLNVDLQEKISVQYESVLRAGDDTYKLVHQRGKYVFAQAAEGLGYLWSDIDTMDFTKNYWFMDNMSDRLTIGGLMVTAVGAANISSYYYTHCMVFNKTMVETLSLESPYQLVRDGKWTWEKFAELAATATFELDGDGKRTWEDSWGFFADSKEISEVFLATADKTLLTKDEDDYPLFNLDTDEEFLDLFTQIFELLYDGRFWKWTWAESLGTETGVAVFSGNHSLTADCTFGYISHLRDMDADFGVIPFPKHDESMDVYYSWNEEIFLPMIPSVISASDALMTGAVLEAMSSYAIRYTIPEYYEVQLKTKFARDEESGEMFDIIMAHRIFDPGMMWVDDVEHAIRDLFVNDKRTKIVSEIKRKTDPINLALEELTAGLENNAKSIFG
jgi:hypothetical protein